MSHPPRPRHPDRTREALLRAATALFAESGYDGVTIARIARRARVNKAMISYHFGGKRKLYLTILLEVFSVVGARVKAIRESDLSADLKLREFLSAFRELVAERPSFPPMMAREILSGGRSLDQKVLAQFLGVFSLVRDIIEQGVREGCFRPVDPALTHVGLMGSLVLFFCTEQFRSRLGGRDGNLAGLDPDAFVRHLEELMIRGLAADAGGTGGTGGTTRGAAGEGNP